MVGGCNSYFLIKLPGNKKAGNARFFSLYPFSFTAMPKPLGKRHYAIAPLIFCLIKRFVSAQK